MDKEKLYDICRKSGIPDYMTEQLYISFQPIKSAEYYEEMERLSKIQTMKMKFS